MYKIQRQGLEWGVWHKKMIDSCLNIWSGVQGVKGILRQIEVNYLKIREKRNTIFHINIFPCAIVNVDRWVENKNIRK